MSAPGSGPFEIYLAWSDVTLTVGAGESALQVLVAAGLPIEPGCQTGGCGTCVTDYVEGDVIHKDACLSESDRRHSFCPCVSRARTRIVLAL
ncbi:MAG: 2Fe-2S iron-sulfur cluster binding domain-containing protein [Hyphomicrobiaceae bacterium]|nr:2Fe-2S iron-sulfur cluster binding domain-containing protein [Hyphomicrobiaceae bacterium]